MFLSVVAGCFRALRIEDLNFNLVPVVFEVSESEESIRGVKPTA